MRELTKSSRTIYDGRVVRLELLDVELEDGRPAFREIVRHARAVAVLAREPDGRFLFVRQFRKAMESLCLELVAGLNEPGEDPDVAVRRELREETGAEAVRLVHLGEVWASPGYVDEKIDLYYAECAAQRGARSLDEDERLEVVPLTSAEIEALIRDNTLRDAKTLAAWALYRIKVAADGSH